MKVEDVTRLLPFDGLKTKKVMSNERFDMILISLEKDAILKEHVSNTEAAILIVDGKIEFTIHGVAHILKQNALFSFSKNVKHKLKGLENSKMSPLRKVFQDIN